MATSSGLKCEFQLASVLQISSLRGKANRATDKPLPSKRPVSAYRTPNLYRQSAKAKDADTARMPKAPPLVSSLDDLEIMLNKHFLAVQKRLEALGLIQQPQEAPEASDTDSQGRRQE